jgi:hypothetical protein
MIISPPFLPQRDADQTDNDWLDKAMTQPPSRLSSTGAPEGSYPLSNRLAWHNGLHLQGQAGADGHTVVRAIADGEVIYVGQPRQSNTEASDAQNYNPFGDAPAWTDNGCIIIRHATEIGATGNQPTEFVYYSLVTHLCQIGRITPPGQTAPRPLRCGDRIWRKDEIGRAGQIYGHTGQVHLEICLDEANLTRLIGRPPAWVNSSNIPPPTEDGRIDAVFGSIWFYLPAATPTRATPPQNHLRTITQSKLGEPLWVRMNYEQGACTFESYGTCGRWRGPKRQNVEYDLYTLATQRHANLPETARALSSPSGWYELLRFGRNLGRGAAQTDKDPLPADAAHWREIPGPNGQPIWADLNAEGTHKFSDADFLPVQGWIFVDDDTCPEDQLCDSSNLLNLIAAPDASSTERMETANLARRLGDGAIVDKLRRMVCRFPSEWDQTTIAARYAFVRELKPFPETPDGWASFESHLRALSFPDLPAEYSAATWWIHPGEFISAMRKSGWLSKRELLQLVPSHAIRRHGQSHLWEAIPQATFNLAKNQILTRERLVAINRMLRKHGINTSMRQASFFGNAVQETVWLSTLAEQAPNLRWYAPWYGRGLLQLTHPDNYIGYWRWRGRNIAHALETALSNAKTIAHTTGSNQGLQDSNFPALTAQMRTWRAQVGGVTSPPEGPPGAEENYAPADSAGYYWAKLRMAHHADDHHNIERVTVITSEGPKVYYRSPAFWRASAAVNLPGAIQNTYSNQLNGFDSRCCAYSVALAVLGDAMLSDAQGQATLLYPEGYKRRAA